MTRLPIYQPVRLPAEQAYALRALAAMNNCTVSELHRQAIATFLAAQAGSAPSPHRPRAERSAHIDK